MFQNTTTVPLRIGPHGTKNTGNQLSDRLAPKYTFAKSPRLSGTKSKKSQLQRKSNADAADSIRTSGNWYIVFKNCQIR